MASDTMTVELDFAESALGELGNELAGFLFDLPPDVFVRGVELRGPGGGWPVIELRGPPDAVERLVRERWGDDGWEDLVT